MSNLPRSLRPVTIAMVKKATPHGELWIVGDDPADEVTLVAELFHHRATPHMRKFLLDDGTARLNAKIWVETPENALDDPWRRIPVSPAGQNQLSEPLYVRVRGHIQHYNGVRYLKVSNMRLVDDANEIYFHLLEVMTVLKQLDERAAIVPVSNLVSHHMVLDLLQRTISVPGALPALSEEAQNVIQALRALGDPPAEGFHIGQLDLLQDRTDEDIAAILWQLVDHSLIYTTIDEWHVMVADVD
ncbi:hypothetical protein R3P38DRAFT_3168859 [Favolaschia claudopus]|uniref:Uncharacterized protein n=1 Tax=Favolaschia claudopus TaxID=2862362 RepID=A0AAW0E2S5_9AGAR